MLSWGVINQQAAVPEAFLLFAAETAGLVVEERGATAEVGIAVLKLDLEAAAGMASAAERPGPPAD